MGNKRIKASEQGKKEAEERPDGEAGEKTSHRVIEESSYQSSKHSTQQAAEYSNGSSIPCRAPDALIGEEEGFLGRWSRESPRKRLKGNPRYNKMKSPPRRPLSVS